MRPGGHDGELGAAGSDADPDSPAARRARRLLRWYPAAWRARYGDEFAELLISDIRERPRSWARAVDVARGGTVARLARAGLCGFAAGAPGQAAASLASLGCCTGVFLSFGVAMWSQLTIGWQWSEPVQAGTTVATVMMSVMMLVFAGLAVLAAAPVAWSVVSRILGGRSRGLAGPAVVFLAGAAMAIAGGRHFGNGWPGTGGHPWTHPGLVPAGPAAFAWASTLFVTSYWAHPSALAAFPAAELAWMALSPLALACVVGGAATAVRRTGLSPAVLRFEASLGIAACAAMSVFLAGCCLWVLAGDQGQRGLFHFGTIDVGGVAVMTVTLVIAQRTARRARRIGLAPVAP
jgi:hypothetical protein